MSSCREKCRAFSINTPAVCEAIVARPWFVLAIITGAFDMNGGALTPTFIDTQRQRLLELQSTLKSAAAADLDDETSVKEENAGRAQEYEDDAQKLDALEVGGNRVERDLQRLQHIERALEKIAHGTYGLSDVSGEAIP